MENENCLCDAVEDYHVCGECGNELLLTKNGYKCTVCGTINRLEEITIESLCYKNQFVTTQIMETIF